MKYLFSILLILAGLVASAQGKYAEGHVLIQLRKGATAEALVQSMNEHVGIRPQFKIEKEVSAHMRTWLFTFNPSEIDTREMVRIASTLPEAQVAQLNHIVEDRVIPNDPFFSQQWFHVNSNDHDIDTDLAWDITTGGTTAFGDDIVVCVIEPGGTNWAQADIVDNHWTNTNEIPNNGIDDDGNGYTDDYDGWNITGNDNLSNGSHGVSVSSMIGGKGNNNLGVVGVNWDVKIMQVQMNSVLESTVIEAYAYPLQMRKLYNETGGVKGAFVVATNSSWGTDGGQPSEAPLWCAMYDSLGYYGVISCGSTANNDVNVDQVGDLPTACPSDYLISVTATNNQDVRTFSGYGLTTIDLGAPGENVYLASGNGYGNTSGTSFAGPCVAGAVALLYSAPCNSLVPIAYSSPATAAAMVRSYILDGVDTFDNLATECVTGGRLNVNNSLQLLLTECSNSSCIAPFAINATQVPGTLQYTIAWGSIESMTSFEVQYREVGNATWTTVGNLSSATYTTPTLVGCSQYEVQVRSNCSGEWSDWSIAYTFGTTGCCENPATATLVSTGENNATISWTDVFAAVSYTITLSTANAPDLVLANITGNSYSFAGLTNCTSYTATVTTVCSAGATPSGAAATVNFNTTGCGSCVDLNYCLTTGNTNYEWIERVVIGTIDNTSGSDGGYGDYTDMSTALNAGETYAITLDQGYANTAYTEYFKIWIDFNGNGVFDDTELVYDQGQGSNSTVNDNMTIPSNAPAGAARMRVAMAYVGAFGNGTPPVTCGDLGDGEAEDYCVFIQAPNNIAEASADQFLVYPNPAQFAVNLNTGGERATQVCVFNNLGAAVAVWSNPTNNQLDVSGLPNGCYHMTVTTASGKMLREALVIAR